jgi:predicted amidophosphoribosyltransferase
VATFGKSLAEKLNKPYIDTVLKRGQFTNTQTKKLRLDRWKNVSDIFFVENNNTLQNKHILLIDDIITTGATLEACYKAFENTKNIKISIASMAYTK